jgi:hypothetical protein
MERAIKEALEDLLKEEKDVVLKKPFSGFYLSLSHQPNAEKKNSQDYGLAEKTFYLATNGLDFLGKK